MSRRLIVIGISILLLVFTFAASQGSQICKGDQRPILFKRLSDENSFPFHNIGRPLSFWKDKSPYYDDYLAAVARFPEVRACLIDSEREKQIPDLNNFDWNKIKGRQDAEVCTFRVISSIGTLEGSIQWFEGQGFKLSSVDKDGPDMGFQAHWPRECGKRYEEPWNWLRASHELLINSRFWLSVWITAENEVKSTNGGFNSE